MSSTYGPKPRPLPPIPAIFIGAASFNEGIVGMSGSATFAMPMVVMRFVGHYQAFQYATAAYFSLALGIIFWAASDPMFEMVNWLAFPMEFGRVPDEIRHFDTRWIAWPDSDGMIRAHLFRFRYDKDWDYGITSGPLTFAFGDGNLEGKSPEEIYAAYASWYDQPGIRDLRAVED